MNDVLTIVSLVIAICGAAFMAVAAIRDHCRDRIARIREQASKDADNISTAKNSATLRHGQRKIRQLERRLFMWDVIAFAPVAAFCLTAYFISIHVLAVCWSEIPREPSIWTFYRVWIIVLLSINAVAVIALIAMLLAIDATAEDLHAHAEAKAGEPPESLSGWSIKPIPLMQPALKCAAQPEEPSAAETQTS